MGGKDAATLRRFMHSLVRRDRCILLMYYADGMTPREIGAVLDVAEDEVRSMVRRLRDQARALLGIGETTSLSAR